MAPTLCAHAEVDREHRLSVPEAAEDLGVGMKTVYKFLDQGLIPAYKLGRVIRIKRNDADAFLESHRLERGHCDTCTTQASMTKPPNA